MSTKTRHIQEKQWELISSVEIIFQILGNRELRVCESKTIPINLDNFKIALPGEMYNFTPKNTTKLYGYSSAGTISVSLEEV